MIKLKSDNRKLHLLRKKYSYLNNQNYVFLNMMLINYYPSRLLVTQLRLPFVKIKNIFHTNIFSSEANNNI